MFQILLWCCFLCQLDGFDGFDQSGADDLLKKYDVDHSGSLDRSELEVVLLNLQITHDLDDDTVDKLFVHLENKYDVDGSATYDTIEFRNLAKDLRGSGERAIGQDDPGGLYNSALNFYEGKGKFKQSFEEAARLFSLASSLGHPGATHSLGTMYHSGRGVKHDEERAINLFRIAAKKGYVHSMFNVGCILLSRSECDGNGCRVKRKKSVSQFLQQTNKDHEANSCQNDIGRFGRAYHLFRGVIDFVAYVWEADDIAMREYEEAISWLERAAALGSEPAVVRLQRTKREL
jgi:hypothetical protein